MEKRLHKIEQSHCNTQYYSLPPMASYKLASYNFCENVTYKAVSLIGHGYRGFRSGWCVVWSGIIVGYIHRNL